MKTIIDFTDKRHHFFIVLIIIFLFLFVFSAKAEFRTITTQNGSTRRIDYVDENGTIVFNGSKGYASIIQQLDKDRNVIEEYYLDEWNNPIAQSIGHYGKKHVYNSHGQDVLTTYIDQNGNAIIISYGYNSVRREYNDSGQNVKELYYIDKEQVILKNGEAGIFKEYDDYGRNNQITYLDLDGMPITIKGGYSSLSRSFNDAGYIEYEYYLDLNKEPVQANNGAYGLHREYNDEGQLVSITYLDSHGLPTLNSNGYSIIQYNYDVSGKASEERFFNTMGIPISIGRGQYGIKRIYKDNLLIRSIPLGDNGQELFFADIFLSEHPLIVIIGAIVLFVIIFISNRKFNIFLLCTYILFILYMTIFARLGNVSNHSFVFFGSYKQIFSSSSARIEILENILLFIPLGVLLKSLWPSNKAIYWFLWLPAIIEIIQFFSNLGELQFDDIVSNSIGFFVGTFLFSRFQKTENAYAAIKIVHIKHRS